MTHLYNIIPRH